MTERIYGNCDAEIGKPGDWRGCRRKAFVRIWREDSIGVYYLDYCARHADREHVKPAGAINLRRELL